MIVLMSHPEPLFKKPSYMFPVMAGWRQLPLRVRERKFRDSSCMTYSFVREVQRLTELGSDESRIPEYGAQYPAPRSRHTDLVLRPSLRTWYDVPRISF